MELLAIHAGGLAFECIAGRLAAAARHHPGSYVICGLKLPVLCKLSLLTDFDDNAFLTKIVKLLEFCRTPRARAKVGTRFGVYG